MGRLEREKWSANGVIVTVYEESATVGSQHHRNPKIKPRNSRPRYSSGGGYDRRAELLAYTHHLRNAGSQQDSTPTDPMHKPKKRRRLLGPLRKLRRSFGQLFEGKKRVWRYEKIETEKDEKKCPGKNTWNKMSKSISSFLKELSSSLKCNK